MKELNTLQELYLDNTKNGVEFVMELPVE